MGWFARLSQFDFVITSRASVRMSHLKFSHSAGYLDCLNFEVRELF